MIVGIDRCKYKACRMVKYPYRMFCKVVDYMYDNGSI